MIHVLAFPHTELTPEYESCAFTARTRTFAPMMGEQIRTMEGAETLVTLGPWTPKELASMQRQTTAVPARLMAKIGPTTERGCWPWLAATKPDGRPEATYNHRVWNVARLMYELIVGPVPTGLVLDHLCRNLWCVNPAHLDPVTQATNIRRGDAGKNGWAKTRCIRGHAFDDDNTIRHPNGRRNCRTCQRMHARLWARRHRAQASA